MQVFTRCFNYCNRSWIWTASKTRGVRSHDAIPHGKQKQQPNTKKQHNQTKTGKPANKKTQKQSNQHNQAVGKASQHYLWDVVTRQLMCPVLSRSCLVWFCWWVLLVCVFYCTPVWTLDCVMVRAPFWLPNAGYWSMQWVIRSSAQTMCDDLARAEEATDGKKMWRFAMQHHPSNIHQPFATPRYSATPVLCFNSSAQCNWQYRNDGGVRKPSILHFPTSFPKQIPTPSRFKLILLFNNGIDWKDHDSYPFWAENFGGSLEGQGGGQQGAVEYSIQSFQWKPATCAHAVPSGQLGGPPGQLEELSVVIVYLGR